MIRIIKAILFFLLAIFFDAVFAQDIALHKPYTLSALPNYPYTAPSTDSSSLTDGIYTSGYFWSKPTTVGWTRRQVTITIDLGQVQSVGSVTFNSVRRSDQNVEFPENIYVFLSQDNQQYTFAGDAAENNNMPGPYLVKKFVLANININARFVSIVVIPQKNNLFCDEIEVLKGENKKNHGNYSIPRERLKIAVDSLKNIAFAQKELKRTLVEYNKNVSKENAEYQQVDSISAKNVESLLERIRKVHADNLKRTFNSSFVIEKYNPWDTLAPLHYPSKSKEIHNYDFVVQQNGATYGAFVLTNASMQSRLFEFKETSSDYSSLNLFNVPYVPSVDGTVVPDPLVKVNSNVTIPVGVSQLFIFKITGNKKGQSYLQIAVTSETHTIYLNIGVLTVDLYTPHQNPLNAVNWAYLTSPLLQERKDHVSPDLESHHINTIVVPPQIIPKPGNSNFSGLINYVSNFKFAKNILISTGYATAGNRDVDRNLEFLSLKWKKDFIEWYKNLLAAFKAAGITSQVYFYPYDEVPDNYISVFKQLAAWAGSVPGLKIYATISSKKAIDSIMPLIDIAQIQVPLTLEMPFTFPAHHCEIWVYSGSSPARSLSPYRFYRLMSWQAFANNIEGIGFWNYADEGLDKKVNLISDPMLNPSTSYSVIYDGPGTEILSSRRWEAFSLGIQDYAILQMYANKYGKEKAKNIAQKVISNPQNISLADGAITEMLKML